MVGSCSTAGICSLPYVPFQGENNAESIFRPTFNMIIFLVYFSLLLGCWLFFFPESPKFLIECGETEEALEILKYMYTENTGKGKTEYPVSAGFTSQ